MSNDYANTQEQKRKAWRQKKNYCIDWERERVFDVFTSEYGHIFIVYKLRLWPIII